MFLEASNLGSSTSKAASEAQPWGRSPEFLLISREGRDRLRGSASGFLSLEFGVQREHRSCLRYLFVGRRGSEQDPIMIDIWAAFCSLVTVARQT
jgi:hypothetical protein